MKKLWVVAANELRAGFRNRMVAATILVLGGLALVLVLFGSTPIGETRASSLSVIYVSLTSLSIYLIPLLALMLSFDTVVGESERGSLLLLLSYPLSRRQLLFGKYLGHLMILALAVVIGYGGAGLYLLMDGQGSMGEWISYCAMMLTSILLGAVFLATGSLISIVAKERSTAVGAAIVVWLLVVVVYDLGLLALLVHDTEYKISSDLLATLIAINPTDAYRLFNITSAESAAMVSGMSNLGEENIWSPVALVGVLLVWVIALLTLNQRLFAHREL